MQCGQAQCIISACNAKVWSLIELTPISSASSPTVHCVFHPETGLETLGLRKFGKNTSLKSLKHQSSNPLPRLNPCNLGFISWHMKNPSDKHAIQMSCDVWTWGSSSTDMAEVAEAVTSLSCSVNPDLSMGSAGNCQSPD